MIILLQKKTSIKIIAWVLLCLFSINSVSWAYPERQIAPSSSTLSTQPLSKALQEVGVETPAELTLELITGLRLLLAGKSVDAVNGYLIEMYRRSGDTRKVEFLEDVKIERHSIKAKIRIIGNNDVVFGIDYVDLLTDPAAGDARIRGVFQKDDAIVITKPGQTFKPLTSISSDSTPEGTRIDNGLVFKADEDPAIIAKALKERKIIKSTKVKEIIRMIRILQRYFKEIRSRAPNKTEDMSSYQIEFRNNVKHYAALEGNRIIIDAHLFADPYRLPKKEFVPLLAFVLGHEGSHSPSLAGDDEAKAQDMDLERFKAFSFKHKKAILGIFNFLNADPAYLARLEKLWARDALRETLLSLNFVDPQKLSRNPSLYWKAVRSAVKDAAKSTFVPHDELLISPAGLSPDYYLDQLVTKGYIAISESGHEEMGEFFNKWIEALMELPPLDTPIGKIDPKRLLVAGGIDKYEGADGAEGLVRDIEILRALGVISFSPRDPIDLKTASEILENRKKVLAEKSAPKEPPTPQKETAGPKPGPAAGEGGMSLEQSFRNVIESYIFDTWLRDRILLRSHPLTGYLQEKLDRIVRDRKAKVYVISDENMSAFTNGTNQIYVTTGLLKWLTTEEEVYALLMHELAHIEKSDTFNLRNALSFEQRYTHGAYRAMEITSDFASIFELDKRGINPQGAITLSKKFIEIRTNEQKKTYSFYTPDNEDKDGYWDRVINDLRDMDITHGSMDTRHGQFRDLIRLVELPNLSDKTTPVDWTSLGMDSIKTVAAPKVIRDIARKDKEDFWITFAGYLKTAPQEIWTKAVLDFMHNQGVKLDRETEQAILMIVQRMFLGDQNDLSYRDGDRDVTVSKDESISLEAVMRLLDEDIPEKIGLHLSPPKLFSITRDILEDLLKGKSADELVGLADRINALRRSMTGYYRKKYGNTFDFLRRWDTKLAEAYVISQTVDGRAEYTKMPSAKDSGAFEEYPAMDMPMVSFSKPIPLKQIDMDKFNLFFNKANIGIVQFEPILEGVVVELGFGEIFEPEQKLAEMPVFCYHPGDEIVSGFIARMCDITQALVMHQEDIARKSHMTDMERLEMACLSMGRNFMLAVMPDDLTEKGKDERRFRERSENPLPKGFGYAELMPLIGAQAYAMLEDDLGRLEGMDADAMVLKFLEWYKGLDATTDTQRRLIDVASIVDGYFSTVLEWFTKFDRDGYDREEEGEEELEGRAAYNEIKKAIILDLFRAPSKEMFIAGVNETLKTRYAQRSVKEPKGMMDWVENMVRLRNEARPDERWEFGLNEKARLRSLLITIKTEVLQELASRAFRNAEDVFKEAVNAVNKFGIVFVGIDQEEYDKYWRDISWKLNTYLQDKKDFPKTSGDFEKLLAVSLLAQGSFNSINLAAISFREMVKRAKTFDEAFSYLERYEFLPTSLLKDGLFALVEEKARTRAEIEKLNDWFLERVERLVSPGGDMTTMIVSEALFRLIESDERLTFMKHIISTNESDEGLKRYVAGKWWRMFDSSFVDVSEIDEITMLAYYGELAENPEIKNDKLTMAKARAANRLDKEKIRGTSMIFFSEIYTALYMLDDLIIYHLLRVLTVEGANGLFKDKEAKADLVNHFIDHYIRLDDTPASKGVVEDIRSTLSEDLEPEDLFYFFGPALAQMTLQTPNQSYPIDKIVDELVDGHLKRVAEKYPGIGDPGKFPETQRIIRSRFKACVVGIFDELRINGNTSKQELVEVKHAPYANVENTVLEKIADLVSKRKVFGEKIVPMELAVEVAKHVGSLAVRLLQLVGMYFKLSPEDRTILSQVFDGVRGQNKIQLYNTMKREAETNPHLKELFDKITELREMLGGGSIVTVYEAVTEDRNRWAVGVKNPNSEYRSKELLDFANQVLDGLIKRGDSRGAAEVKYYRLLKLVLDDAHQWVLNELNDLDYVRKNAVFAGHNDHRLQEKGRFTAAGDLGQKLFVPNIVDTKTDKVRWEELIDGDAFNAFLVKVSQTGDTEEKIKAKAIVATLTQNYFYQIFESGYVHSDIHPGQFIMMDGGRNAILDRKNILIFEESERSLIFQVIINVILGQKDEAFNLVMQKFIPEERLKDKEFVAALKATVFTGLKLTSPEEVISEIFFKSQELGIKLPLKWILVAKNFMALNRMAQLAGLENMIGALLYTGKEGDTSSTIIKLGKLAATVLPKSYNRLIAQLGSSFLSGKVSPILRMIMGSIPDFSSLFRGSGKTDTFKPLTKPGAAKKAGERLDAPLVFGADEDPKVIARELAGRKILMADNMVGMIAVLQRYFKMIRARAPNKTEDISSYQIEFRNNVKHYAALEGKKIIIDIALLDLPGVDPRKDLMPFLAFVLGHEGSHASSLAGKSESRAQDMDVERFRAFSPPNRASVTSILTKLGAEEEYVAKLEKAVDPKVRLFAQHKDEKYLLSKTGEYLKGRPINMHIDLSAIPRAGLTEEEAALELEMNMETLARIIAWHNSLGFDIRYILEAGPDTLYNQRAEAILKEKLKQLAAMPGINTDDLLARLGPPLTGWNVIDVSLKSLKNIDKAQKIGENEYVVALKEDARSQGFSIPNYAAASTIGLSLAALRVAKDEKGAEYARIKKSVLAKIRDIYARYGINADGFTGDVLDLMVAGGPDTKLYYVMLYSLPPIVKAAIEKLREYHESLHLLLQAA